MKHLNHAKGGVDVSSEISPTTEVVKMTWHVALSTDAIVHDAVLEQAKREDRSRSYIVSRIVEKYYEERAKLKIV